MVYIRLLVHRTGGRYDNREWPGFGAVFDIPEWEAEDMIREGQAEYPDEPALKRGYDVLKVASPDYESGLKRTDGEDEDEDPRYVHHSVREEAEDDYDSDFDRDDGDNDFEREEVTPQVKKPYANAPKADWVRYARSKGDMEADAKTKAALIDLYG